jgi:hypothetical protein
MTMPIAKDATTTTTMPVGQLQIRASEIMDEEAALPHVLLSASGLP